MLKKLVICILLFFLVLVVILPSLPLPVNTNGQTGNETLKGVVTEVTTDKIPSNTSVFNLMTQNTAVLVENGKDKGKTVDVFYQPNGTNFPVLQKGDGVVLSKMIMSGGSTTYTVIEKYRFDKILIILFGFFVLIFLVAGKKGFASILGLIISLVAIVGYVFPQIVAGRDPLTTSVIASFFILLITTFVAHGISKKTAIAFISTSLALILTIVLSTAAVKFTGLTGYPNDDATDLHYLLTTTNIRGLFLSGIIITTLGALNDITIVQATTIFHIAKIKKNINFIELMEQGFMVGREHILSLINTLVLAYAGSSVSLLLGFFLIPTTRPFWSIVNNELIAEEIVKTVAGTAGLVLSVPIVTLLAAYLATRKRME